MKFNIWYLFFDFKIFFLHLYSFETFFIKLTPRYCQVFFSSSWCPSLWLIWSYFLLCVSLLGLFFFLFSIWFLAGKFWWVCLDFFEAALLWVGEGPLLIYLIEIPSFGRLSYRKSDTLFEAISTDFSTTDCSRSLNTNTSFGSSLASNCGKSPLVAASSVFCQSETGQGFCDRSSSSSQERQTKEQPAQAWLFHLLPRDDH